MLDFRINYIPVVTHMMTFRLSGETIWAPTILYSGAPHKITILDMVILYGAHYKTDMCKLENIQRKATRMVDSLKHLDYLGRLQALHLLTLQYGRYRDDMLAVYKIYTVNTISRVHNIKSVLL